MKVNTIICGDCLEVMTEWPDNCVELVLTDPPYGINADRMKMGTGRHDWDVVVGWDEICPDRIVFDTIKRISDNQIINFNS